MAKQGGRAETIYSAMVIATYNGGGCNNGGVACWANPHFPQVIADGVVANPLFLHAYFATIGLLEGHKPREILAHTKEQFHQAWGLALVIWTPGMNRIYTHIHMYIYVCVCVCRYREEVIHVYIHVYAHVYMCMCIHTHIRLFTCIYLFTSEYMCVYI